MNISYNWLKKYLDFSLTPDELAAALTSIGLETGGVEEVESIRGGLRGIVIGKVLTCEEHPNSDHLHITTVDLGDGQPTQIVCGAPNVAAGQTVVVATVGTTLYGPEGEEFQIKKSKIRGVESFGSSYFLTLCIVFFVSISLFSALIFIILTIDWFGIWFVIGFVFVLFYVSKVLSFILDLCFV